MRRYLFVAILACCFTTGQGFRKLVVQSQLHGSDKEELTDDTTIMLAERVGACLDPDSSPLDALQKALSSAIAEDAKAGRDSSYAATLLSTPIDLQMGGVQLGKMIPHLIAGLAPMPHVQVNATEDNPRGVPDAACFTYDYTSGVNTPDPYGCRAFRKSFEPVAKLRSCIVPKLAHDQKWKRHRETMVKENGTEPGDQSWAQWCTAEFPECEDYDTLRRAEDIIKAVGFKALPEDPMEARKYIIQKSGSSRILKAGAMLEEATMEAIADDCFKAKETALMRSLWSHSQCLPMMYNSLEWGAMGIFDAAVKYNHPPHANNDAPTDVKQHLGVPPVCGRLAAGLIAQPFEHSRFGIIASWRNAIRRWDWETHCLHPAKGNCRLFATCWEEALAKLCSVADVCCGTKGSWFS